MKLLYIINGIGFASNVSLGGSDKRAMEIGLRLKRAGHIISVFTTTSGNMLLQDSLPVQYFVITEPWFLKGSIKNGLLGRILAYFYVTAIGCFYPFKERFDILFPTSDFFFDVIPAVFYKLRGISEKLVFIVHHAIPSPFKRKGGLLKNFVLFWSQRMIFLIMGIFGDAVFVYKTKEGEKIRDVLKRFAVPQENVASVFCGIDLQKMAKISQGKKEFFACFIGGLRPAKGLLDLVPIWKKVCSYVANSKLLIIGSGLNVYINRLHNDIKTANLENNINLITGHIDEAKLYEMLASSALLILPSYEEGWSIIICEALSLGLPAIVYNLDVFDIFEDTCLRVELGDTKAFAQNIIEVLNNKKLYENLKTKALALSKKFDWDAVANLDEELLLKVINK